jgi:hypothetical protein
MQRRSPIGVFDLLLVGACFLHNDPALHGAGLGKIGPASFAPCLEFNV